MSIQLIGLHLMYPETRITSFNCKVKRTQATRVLFYATSCSLCSGATNVVLASSLFTLKKIVEFKKSPLKFLSSSTRRRPQYTFSNQFSKNSIAFFVFGEKYQILVCSSVHQWRHHNSCKKAGWMLKNLWSCEFYQSEQDFITVVLVDFRPEY